MLLDAAVPVQTLQAAMRKRARSEFEPDALPVRFGSNFSGLDTGFIKGGQQLTKLGRSAEKIFSCDSARAPTGSSCIRARPVYFTTTYCFGTHRRWTGPTCSSSRFRAQSSRKLDQSLGLPRQIGKLLFASLDDIRAHTPRAVIMQHCPLLARKFKYDLDCIVVFLEGVGYSASYKM